MFAFIFCKLFVIGIKPVFYAWMFARSPREMYNRVKPSVLNISQAPWQMQGAQLPTYVVYVIKLLTSMR